MTLVPSVIACAVPVIVISPDQLPSSLRQWNFAVFCVPSAVTSSVTTPSAAPVYTPLRDAEMAIS